MEEHGIAFTEGAVPTAVELLASGAKKVSWRLAFTQTIYNTKGTRAHAQGTDLRGGG